MMSDKFPEYIPIDHYPNYGFSSQSTNHQSTESLQTTLRNYPPGISYINNPKIQSTSNALFETNPPPGFQYAFIPSYEPRRHISEFCSTPLKPPSEMTQHQNMKMISKDYLNFKPLSQIVLATTPHTNVFDSNSLVIPMQEMSLSSNCLSKVEQVEPTQDKSQSSKSNKVSKKKSKGGPFAGNLIEKIKDPRSSQYLQKSIQKASSSTISQIINSVLN